MDRAGLTSLGVKASSPIMNLGKKSLISAALYPVHTELAAVKKALPERFLRLKGSGREVVQYVFDGQGKHIRPAIFLMAAKMLRYDGEHLIPIAAVCEYVHTASLLHDDVVDNSTMRRNKKTTNSIWGDESAVLVGDLIYATASEILAASGHLELVGGFARAIRKMSEGELIQLDHSFDWSTDESTYFHILSAKTGVLMGVACRAAGILAGLGNKEKDVLEQFGHGLGISFQMIDDALDFLGESSIFGKKALADLKEGRVTLPLILLRSQASASEWEKATRLLSASSEEEATLKYVSSLVEKYGCATQTVQLARQKAEQNAHDLRSCFSDSPMRSHLEGLAQLLVDRVV